MMDHNSEISLPLGVVKIIETQPDAVNDLLWDLGYERVESPEELLLAVQALIETSGQQAVDMLLALSKPACGCKTAKQKSTEDNLCGACGGLSYTGVPGSDYLEEISQMNTPALTKRYSELKKTTESDPENLELSREIELVWNELRMRKLTQKEVSVSQAFARKARVERALGVGLLLGCFLLGIFVATQAGKANTNA